MAPSVVARVSMKVIATTIASFSVKQQKKWVWPKEWSNSKNIFRASAVF